MLLVRNDLEFIYLKSILMSNTFFFLFELSFPLLIIDMQLVIWFNKLTSYESCYSPHVHVSLSCFFFFLQHDFIKYYIQIQERDVFKNKLYLFLWLLFVPNSNDWCSFVENKSWMKTWQKDTKYHVFCSHMITLWGTGLNVNDYSLKN